MDLEINRLKKENRIPQNIRRRFDATLWLVFDPLSFHAESYRRLRTNLLRIQLKKDLRALLVTSPSPGEGKSTTLANLAVTMAETQKRILLVDADLRRPIVHTVFGLPSTPGLTDYLLRESGLERVLRRDIVENLDILPCGTVVSQPAQLFASKAMKDFVCDVKGLYDFVLIDAPPVLVVNDAAVIGTAVDCVILVVATGVTRMAALERAAEFMEVAGADLLGIAMNRFDARRAYGSYYGSNRYGHYQPYDSYYSSSGKEGKKVSGGVI